MDDPKLREQAVTDDYEAMIEAMEEGLAEGDAPLRIDAEVMRRLAEAKGEGASKPPNPSKLPAKPSEPGRKPSEPAVETSVARSPDPEDDFETVAEDKW